MEKDGIINLHYRKLLTERDIIIKYIKILKKAGNTKLTLMDIQVLCLLLIDLNNMDKELITEEDLEPIKEYLKSLENSFYEAKECYIDSLIQIINLQSSKRISDELNESIAFKYAGLINQKEILLPVNNEVLKKAFK